LKRRLALTATLALALATPLAVAAPASAYATQVRVDLRVLVVNDGTATVDAIVVQLDREGVPYDTVDLTSAGRAKITTSTLSDIVNGVARAKYQGVVVPNENALPADEMTALTDFERTFSIRQIDAYTWSGANVGESMAWGGVLDGTPLAVTDAAKAAGFGYLKGSLTVDDRDPAVSESYGYLAAPLVTAPATLTPLVTGARDGQTGSVLAVYSHDGRDELVVTMAENRYQTQGMLLAHGMVGWLTQGIHLGYWRNVFTMHVDDVFLPDDRWSITDNCTVGDGCPAGVTNTTIRMIGSGTDNDVDHLVAWQKQQGIKLDLAFNGGGSDEAGVTDPLTAQVVVDKAQLRFINHTYAHPYLGCVQNFAVVPWQCATDPATGATQWVSQAEITAAIKDNVTWAGIRGLPITASEVVTGEHSGLKSLPQMPTDNPNLAPALTAAGIKVLASDASRETTPRKVGPATTVPRHPMNIFYNVTARAEEVDEYNWLYNSAADGGSGICANDPTSTCIPPLSTDTGFDSYIVPLESRIAFDHVVSADSDPHYAHQSNLTGDRILYPVLDSLLARYRATFTTATPIVNPTYSGVAALQGRQQAWRLAVAARTVEAYVQNGRVTVTNKGSAAVEVPVTAPSGTQNAALVLGMEIKTGLFGDVYGTERSAWKNTARGAQFLLRLPS
jgi:hypothetical protein